MKKSKRASRRAEEKGSRRYTVQYWTATWEEAESLTRSCSAASAMIELALWLKSRQDDREDDNVIVLSVYTSYPFMTISEEGSYDEQEER